MSDEQLDRLSRRRALFSYIAPNAPNSQLRYVSRRGMIGGRLQSAELKFAKCSRFMIIAGDL